MPMCDEIQCADHKVFYFFFYEAVNVTMSLNTEHAHSATNTIRSFKLFYHIQITLLKATNVKLS